MQEACVEVSRTKLVADRPASESLDSHDDRLSFPIQPSSHRLRNLTLGVLIVSGGTLAALPFRRVPNQRGPHDASVRATGPTFTPLDTSSVEVNFDRPAQVPATVIGSRPWQMPVVTEPMHGERFIQMPDTYSEDMTPLPRPQIVAERYSASVQYQTEAMSDRQASDRASVMSGDLAYSMSRPSYGPLVGNPEQLARADTDPRESRFSELATRVDASAASTNSPPPASQLATDSLATAPRITPSSNRTAGFTHESNSVDEPAVEPAPPLPPAQPERPRLWIRQPN